MTADVRPPILTAPGPATPVRDRGGSSPPGTPPGASVGPAVRAIDVCKRFGDTDVVRDLCFEVEPGRIFGIIGPSGCGKTTTVRMLLGVHPPTSGELYVMGRRPHELRRSETKHLGYMPQLFVLFPELSVLENMNFVAGLYGMGWFGRRKAIRSTLEFVELWDVRGRPANRLSGGMQRRLQLAATLVHDPEIVVLDEPTAGIDPVLRAKFWEHFRELRDQGRTLIVTTQYVTEAEYCDQIAVLKGGRLLTAGEPDAVRARVMGGEVFTITGPDLGRRAVDAIRAVAGVRGVRRLGDERLEVVVDDAGQALPDLMEATQAAGVAVDEIEESHPSFDDVFVRLMGQEVDADTDAGAS